MKAAVTIASMLSRLTGLIQIVLGMLFWVGYAENLIHVHILCGIVLVVSLWALAILSIRAGVKPGLAILALVWGLITIILGLEQGRILVSALHWIAQVVHLLVGLGAIGLAEALAARIRHVSPSGKIASGQTV